MKIVLFFFPHLVALPLECAGQRPLSELSKRCVCFHWRNFRYSLCRRLPGPSPTKGRISPLKALCMTRHQKKINPNESCFKKEAEKKEREKNGGGGEKPSRALLSPAMTSELWHQGARLDRRELLKASKSPHVTRMRWACAAPRRRNETRLTAFPNVSVARRVRKIVSENKQIGRHNKHSEQRGPGREDLAVIGCLSRKSLFQASGDLLLFSCSADPAPKKIWQGGKKHTRWEKKASLLRLVCVYFKGTFHQQRLPRSFTRIQIHWFAKLISACINLKYTSLIFILKWFIII